MENPSLTYAHVQLGLNECTLHSRASWGHTCQETCRPTAEGHRARRERLRRKWKWSPVIRNVHPSAENQIPSLHILSRARTCCNNNKSFGRGRMTEEGKWHPNEQDINLILKKRKKRCICVCVYEWLCPSNPAKWIRAACSPATRPPPPQVAI